MWRYASMGIAMARCLSRLSQVGSAIKMAGWIELALAQRLLSTSPTVCFKEIQTSTQIRVLPAVTFP